MHITEMRIRHFRNFLKARFTFCKGVNTLIGENGSGKSNAFYALRLLLDDSLSRNATQLRETDFCRALSEWQGHWIAISIDFAELDPSEGCQILKHETGHMNGTETGSYTFYFRPKLEVRKRLYEMHKKGSGREDFTRYLGGLTVDDYEPFFSGRATADLLFDDTYDQVVGDFTSYTFPDPDQDDQHLIGVRMGHIHNEITCTFAQALRDVVSDLRGYRSNPLLALLRGTETSIQIEDADRITETVASLNRTISSLAEIKKIAQGVQETLYSTVGHAYSPSVSVESAVPDGLDQLLKRLTVKVGDNPISDYQGELWEQSLGGANLVYLALKLLEYEVKLSSDRVAHFLLIEEPESHIHTHIQKTLFENQSAKNTQVIVSTHSTHVSSAARIRAVNVLARMEEHAQVYQPAEGLEASAAARVERYLDAVRSTLLFAKGVILVEGQAELIMIPAMTKAVFGLIPDELGISVIAMDSAFFEHIATVFHEDRIRRRCAIVTDLDRSLLELPEDPREDGLQEKHARAAQMAGERRRVSLGEFTRGNPWLRVFLAEHTFEVEFIRAGNAPGARAAAQHIYSAGVHLGRVEEELNSDDLSISGRAILKLAEKAGKGWFALLLSQELRQNTAIPSYIREALAFAAGGVSVGAIKRIGLFRITSGQCDASARIEVPELDELQGLPPERFIGRYQEIAPNDELTEFVRCLEVLSID